MEKSRGFTLIELLVVIAIIGILVSIVFINVNNIRIKARNVKRLNDIRSYAVAFDMAFEKNGEYPDPGDTGRYCLGDYQSDSCWDDNNTWEDNTEPKLNDILREFIPSLPADEFTIGSFKGYTYNCTNRTSGICRVIQLYWWMEGTNQSCGIGYVRMYQFGNTQCGYIASF